jgi:hypothetical protein
VDELGIGAYGYDLGAGFPEGFVLLCQSRKFSGSDEGEIGRVEEEDGPFFGGFLRRQRNFAEISLDGIEGLEFEVRYGVSDFYGTALF